MLATVRVYNFAGLTADYGNQPMIHERTVYQYRSLNREMNHWTEQQDVVTSVEYHRPPHYIYWFFPGEEHMRGGTQGPWRSEIESRFNT